LNGRVQVSLLIEKQSESNPPLLSLERQRSLVRKKRDYTIYERTGAFFVRLLPDRDHTRQINQQTPLPMPLLPNQQLTGRYSSSRQSALSLSTDKASLILSVRPLAIVEILWRNNHKRNLRWKLLPVAVVLLDAQQELPFIITSYCSDRNALDVQ
jgi:hypothetical protein